MIGRDLRTIREACGVTMGDLAGEMCWSVPHVSDTERDTWHVTDRDAAVYITGLARIVRARTPVVTIDVSGGAR